MSFAPVKDIDEQFITGILCLCANFFRSFHYADLTPLYFFIYHKDISLAAVLQNTYTVKTLTASVIQWSEFLVTDPEGPGSIPGATTFSEK
jgi:hypothetical protein